MKSEFSTAWKSSSQPRKQRKYRINAPLHLRHKFLSANLSKELRKKHGKRNLPLRTGDEVLVMRGNFAGKKAKVQSVDSKRTRIILENINRQKKDGTKIGVFFRPDKLQIISLHGDDKKRLNKSGEKKNASNKISNK